MRIPLIAGNWKLNKSIAEATSFVDALKALLPETDGVEVLLCPVFTAIAASAAAAQGSSIAIGGQDFFWKDNGAYTGEVSAPLLLDAGATYVLIGHSERRGRFGVPEPELEGPAGAVFGDTDAAVNKKLHAALKHGLIPIVCVGETLSERNLGNTDSIVEDQVARSVAGVAAEQLAKVVFAYEPVWAIGTGETCDSEEANRVCGVIRATILKLYGAEAASAVRIQYGGSVKPDNAAELLSQEHIDGALVGGASLKADSFAAIVKAARTE